MIIYCDGVFDLFHHGHLKHFKMIKDQFPGCFLLVAVMDDKSTEEYKRKPIYNFDFRMNLCNSCKYVDKVLKYETVDKEFIKKHNISMVVHAFYNDKDFEKQKEYFKVPIELNKMKVLNYSHGISTTEIINNINTFDKTMPVKDMSYFINSVCHDSRVLIITNKLINRISEDIDIYGCTSDRDVYLSNVKNSKYKFFLLDSNDMPFKTKFFDYLILESNTSNIPENELIRVSNHIFFNHK